MLWRNSSATWGVIAQSLHWVVAVLVVSQMILAGIAAELPAGDAKRLTLARHMSVGLIILGLMLVRLAWRWRNVSPDEVTGVQWQKTLARSAHIAFYALLFVLPMTGWAMSSAQGTPVTLFGRITLPALAGANAELFSLLRITHQLSSWALGALVVLHAGAALAHHLLLRDGVLQRMLPCPFGTEKH